MQKNVASQQIILFAFDSATGLPKTGDGGNITPYVSKDWGTVTVLASPTATEMDSTNAKGFYRFALAQAETNCNVALFSGKSTTTGIVVVGKVETLTPANYAARVISSTGTGDANTVASGGYVYPTGTAQGSTGSSITLGASTTSAQALPGDKLLLTAGTGAGQPAYISTFNSTTKVATIIGFWPITNPDTSSNYQIVKDGGGVPAQPADVWDPTQVPSRVLSSATNLTSDGSFAVRESTIGVPVTASVSTDIAAVQTKLGTPATASVSTDIAAVKTVIGTPAGSTVSVDIAAVKANTTTLTTSITPTRAAFLDNLSAGAVATQTTANSIAAKTGSLKFSPSGNVTADVEEVKGSTGLSGNGSAATPWGPP